MNQTKLEELQKLIDYSEKQRYQGDGYWMLSWQSDYKEWSIHILDHPSRFKPYGYLDRMQKFYLMEGYKKQERLIYIN